MVSFKTETKFCILIKIPRKNSQKITTFLRKHISYLIQSHRLWVSSSLLISWVCSSHLNYWFKLRLFQESGIDQRIFSVYFSNHFRTFLGLCPSSVSVAVAAAALFISITFFLFHQLCVLHLSLDYYTDSALPDWWDEQQFFVTYNTNITWLFRFNSNGKIFQCWRDSSGFCSWSLQRSDHLHWKELKMQRLVKKSALNRFNDFVLEICERTQTTSFLLNWFTNILWRNDCG